MEYALIASLLLNAVLCFWLKSALKNDYRDPKTGRYRK